MKKVWDRLGITFSTACIIHCIVVAFLPIIYPAIALEFHSSWIHIFAGILVLVTSPLAFLPGYRRHGVSWILGIAVLGLSFIFFGMLLEGHVNDQASHSVSILGSFCLVFAHAKNLQHSHRHKACC